VPRLRPRPRLVYPEQPFHQFLRDTADRQPEEVALRFEDEVLTYRELDARGTSLANALTGLGFGLGSRAVLASGNRPEWLLAMHGISQAGGASVLVNSSWKAAELEHAFALTRPELVLADGPLADVLDRSGIALPERRLCFDDDPPRGWLPFWDVVTSGAGTRPGPLDADLGRLEAFLPFSSGTTGMPKAVRHTHRSAVACVVQRRAGYGVKRTDRLQFFMPLFTIYGVMVSSSAMAAGASLRLFRRFDAPTVLRNLEQERITLAFATGPVAVALRDQPDLERYDLSSLRSFMWGATPVVHEIAEEITARTGVRWFVAYSMTETGVCANPVERPDLWRLDSPGYPLSDVELRVVDLDTGEEVGPGDEGELVVRSPSTMLGYLPEEANDDAFLPGGWFRTGDVGWVEPDGWVHLTDRAKEMLKVSGFQVAPVELERVLLGHPAVADCAVYAVPDTRRGEAPKAAVVRHPGQDVTAEELQAWVADRLARYKHLAAVAFVESIPRNAGGKVLRRVLRDADPDAAADVTARR